MQCDWSSELFQASGDASGTGAADVWGSPPSAVASCCSRSDKEPKVGLTRCAPSFSKKNSFPKSSVIIEERKNIVTFCLLHQVFLSCVSRPDLSPGLGDHSQPPWLGLPGMDRLSRADGSQLSLPSSYQSWAPPGNHHRHPQRSQPKGRTRRRI